MNYNSYLQTPHWKKTREKKLTSNHCQLCGSTRYIQIHHKFYKRVAEMGHVKRGIAKPGSILFNEMNTELVRLCASCHRMWHASHGKELLGRKEIQRIKIMLVMGVEKKVAFFISSQPKLYTDLINHMKKRAVMSGSTENTKNAPVLER